MPNQNKQEEWRKLLRLNILNVNDKDKVFSARAYKHLAENIENLIDSLLQQEREKAVIEYKQFIFNILDGIDIADEQISNKGGGTKAIRLAMESRIIVEPTNNNKEE